MKETEAKTPFFPFKAATLGLIPSLEVSLKIPPTVQLPFFIPKKKKIEDKTEHTQQFDLSLRHA